MLVQHDFTDCFYLWQFFSDLFLTLHFHLANDNSAIVTVGDIIGHQGLQLFMDAGHPVDDKLVISLAREVMAEKVESMMGRRLTDSRTDAAYGVVSEKDVPNEVCMLCYVIG